MAVNCPEPSVATVIADLTPDGVAEATDEDEVVEDVAVEEATEDEIKAGVVQLSLEWQNEASELVLCELLWATARPMKAAKMEDRIANDDLVQSKLRGTEARKRLSNTDGCRSARGYIRVTIKSRRRSSQTRPFSDMSADPSSI